MNRNKARHIDFRNMSVTPKRVKDMIKKGSPPGQWCTALKEEFPVREIAGCEEGSNIKGPNNSYIVLGRDRNASLASGKGGSGGTKCGMIDIVAGHLSGIGNKGSGDVISGPNFALDAARIYITQRGNIDKYFSLFHGNTGIKNTDNASAIGIKADHTRLIGRQTVKIYAGKSSWEGAGFYGEPNSNGGDIKTGSGRIELVAGNYNDIQPAVKGKNLKIALRGIYKNLRALNSAVHTMHTMQVRLNAAMIGHIHPGLGMTPSPNAVIANVENLIKGVAGMSDGVIKQLNIFLREIESVGLGKDKVSIPGHADVLSTNVFLT